MKPSNTETKTETLPSRSTALTGPLPRLLGAVAMAATLPFVSTTVHADDAPSRVNALFNLEMSDKYLTPRGMIVQNKEVTFQPLLLGFVNVYKGDSFIKDFTLVPGVWADYASQAISTTGAPGSPKTSFVEVDPIAGISTTFAGGFKLDITYTAFCMQILGIGTSQHLETKLSFDDSPYLKDFALHPYFSYWQELVGKATAANSPAHLPGTTPGSSYYLELGVAPSYTLGPVKFELPTRVLLPDERFYGTYMPITGAKISSSTVGLWETGIKATVPMNFMPQGYGHWSFHAGFKYMQFVDKQLQAIAYGAGFNAPKKDTCQVYAGVSTFF